MFFGRRMWVNGPLSPWRMPQSKSEPDPHSPRDKKLRLDLRRFSGFSRRLDSKGFRRGWSLYTFVIIFLLSWTSSVSYCATVSASKSLINDALHQHHPDSHLCSHSYPKPHEVSTKYQYQLETKLKHHSINTNYNRVNDSQ